MDRNTSEGTYGQRNWFFPDGDRPPVGEGDLPGHESLVVLNPNRNPAEASITLYFEPGTSPRTFTAEFPPRSVRCLRTDNEEDMEGNTIPVGVQYAISIEADEPIVAQYGRLDNRQSNLAYYTTPGYAQD